MKPFINEKNKEYDGAFLAVIIVSVLMILFYIYVSIRGIGTVNFKSYMGPFLCLLMYFSIIRYTINYFKKGIECTIDDMLFKFGMSTLASLVNLKGGNNIVFICTAVIVFVEPQIMGKWGNPRKTFIQMLIVYVLTIVCAVTNAIFPVERYLSYMGPCIYGIDAFNQVIQWTLFFTLVCVRGKIYFGNKRLRDIVKIDSAGARIYNK